MLYPMLLKADFEKLPGVLRGFHSAPRGGRAKGTVSVRHQSILARLIGFPPAGDGIPLRVEVMAMESKEVWVRHFGNAIRRSVQTVEGDLMVEAMGPVRIFFRLYADSTGIRFVSQRATLWRIPLPLRVIAVTKGQKFSWDFAITVCGIGSYRGSVEPCE